MSNGKMGDNTGESPVHGISDAKITPEKRLEVDREGEVLQQELQKRNVEAERRFHTLYAKHPSFDDRIWSIVRETIEKIHITHEAVGHIALQFPNDKEKYNNARLKERKQCEHLLRLLGEIPSVPSADKEVAENEHAFEVSVAGQLLSLIVQRTQQSRHRPQNAAAPSRLDAHSIIPDATGDGIEAADSDPKIIPAEIVEPAPLPRPIRSVIRAKTKDIPLNTVRVRTAKPPARQFDKVAPREPVPYASDEKMMSVGRPAVVAPLEIPRVSQRTMLDPNLVGVQVRGTEKQLLKKQAKTPPRRFHEKVFDLFAGMSKRVLGPMGLATGAAAGIAAGIAMHDFAENDSDEPSVEVSSATSSGEAERIIADLRNDSAIQHIEPAVVQELVPEKLLVEHVVQKGDRLWDIATEELRARDLKITRERVNYLTHLAEDENNITDNGYSLEIGRTLHLNEMMKAIDEMAGTAIPKTPSPNIGSQYSWTGAEHDGSDVWKNQSREDYTVPLSTLPQTEKFSAPSEKPYSNLPTAEHPEHRMEKGEWIYKIIHLMLRENGLNWSTTRMNRLKNITLIENGMSEDQAKHIPVGTIITFADAAKEIQAMKGKKTKKR